MGRIGIGEGHDEGVEGILRHRADRTENLHRDTANCGVTERFFKSIDGERAFADQGRRGRFAHVGLAARQQPHELLREPLLGFVVDAAGKIGECRDRGRLHAGLGARETGGQFFHRCIDEPRVVGIHAGAGPGGDRGQQRVGVTGCFFKRGIDTLGPQLAERECGGKPQRTLGGIERLGNIAGGAEGGLADRRQRHDRLHAFFSLTGGDAGLEAGDGGGCGGANFGERHARPIPRLRILERLDQERNGLAAHVRQRVQCRQHDRRIGVGKS